MSKKKLKKNRIKQTKAKKTSFRKAIGKNQITKKRTARKKVAKKSLEKKAVGKKESIKKSSHKKAGENTISGKTTKHKTAAKKTKSLKALPGKRKTGKIKKPVKNKNQKSSSNKSQSLIAKVKSRSFMPSLNYREKELKNLLNREKEEKLVLRDMEGRTYCAVENCDYPALVEGYCRIHFFGFFKMIKKKKQILEQDLLTKSYLSLVNKYSEAVFEHLFKDLSSDKDFRLAVKKFADEELDDLEMEEIFSE